MIRSTLCYIERDGKYLLMHRVKKKRDVNEGKWIGVGGKLEEGETPDECLLREVKEETGLTLTEHAFRGKIYFFCEGAPDEVMYLYHATAFEGELVSECDEGELAWVDKEEALALPMWEGDRLFFPLIDRAGEPFTMTLRYKGDTLTESYFGEP
ncbi:MAG: 8-oxo-dGTP diphosphatase [Clostridia bacterium]|nr:8-oxo-dGTP diphosphatase [Clostridia bacterium]